jgi:chromosome segregation ATPase
MKFLFRLYFSCFLALEIKSPIFVSCFKSRWHCFRSQIVNLKLTEKLQMSSHQGFDIESLHKNCQIACKCMYLQAKEFGERVATRKNQEQIANLKVLLNSEKLGNFWLVEKINDLEKQFKSLKDENLKQKEQNDSMKEQNDSMKKQIGSMKEEIGSMKEQIGSMKEQIGSLLIEVEDLKKKNKNLTKKNDELSKKNDELSKKNDNLTIIVENLNQRVANLENKYKSMSIRLLSERLFLLLNEIINNFNSEVRNERNKLAHAEACKEALNSLSHKDQQNFYKELKNYLQTRPSDMPDIVKKVLLPESEEDVSDQAGKLITELESLVN